MIFTSGLFGLDYGQSAPNPTSAWADCQVDLMGQPIVRFHYVSPDGFGAESYGWYHDLFLRVDYLANRLDLVIEIEGEWSVDTSFDISALHDVLLDARWGEADPEDLLVLLLGAARSRVRVAPLSDAHVDHVDDLLTAQPSVAEELAQRGRWQRATSSDPTDQDEAR